MFNRLSGLAVGSVFALALAGCQETTQTAARPRVDAPGIPVSVQSISGAPDDVTSNFTSLLGEAAAERRMEIVPGDKPARFRVKGYLTALPTEDGQTALAFVWDVYDSSKQRAQRVQGESIGKRGGGSDPWTAIDRTVVAKAAADSMDAIAGFLVTMPPDATPLPAATTGSKPDGKKTAAAGAATTGSGKRL